MRVTGKWNSEQKVRVTGKWNSEQKVRVTGKWNSEQKVRVTGPLGCFVHCHPWINIPEQRSTDGISC